MADQDSRDICSIVSVRNDTILTPMTQTQRERNSLFGGLQSYENFLHKMEQIPA